MGPLAPEASVDVGVSDGPRNIILLVSDQYLLKGYLNFLHKIQVKIKILTELRPVFDRLFYWIKILVFP